MVGYRGRGRLDAVYSRERPELNSREFLPSWQIVGTDAKTGWADA
jgi:hypothetical protein